MDPINHWRNLPANRSNGQFSIRNLLVLTVIAAIAVANPQLAIFAPFAIGLSLIIAVMIVIAGAIQLLFSHDRRLVVSIAWKNLKIISLFAIGLIAYTAFISWVYEAPVLKW